MNDDELRRDLAEEDELRRLLHRTEPTKVPPFAAVALRADRRAGMGTLAAAAGAVLVVAAIVLSRPASQTPVAASPSASLSPASIVGCALPSSLDLARHVTSASLITSLSSVSLTDQRTNQLRWTVGFLSTRDAPGPTTLRASIQITAGGSPLHVLGYELIDPEQRTLADTDLVAIAPCRAAAIVVRTAGPIIDGTWPYQVTIEKIGLPDGTTVTETLSVTLTCSTATFTCAPLLAGQTAPPSTTPNPAVLKSGFGVIYSGVRQGWDQGSAPQIRQEGETDREAGELAGSFFNNFRGTVSPSGRRAAYTGQTQDGQWGLYLLDGARPAEQRRLLALPNEIPGEVAWAADETAIAFNVQDFGATQGVAPKYSAIRTLDLPSGTVNELARVTGGTLYHVVAWNKASGTLAATIAPNGEPATRYVVIGPAGTKTTPLDGAWGMYGSPDARTAIGVRCDGAPAYCSLWTWPLDDFGSRADQHLESGLSLGVVGWRPGSNEIGLVVGSGPKGQEQIEVWSPTAGRRIVYRFVDGKTPPSRPFFRADGSAIFVPGYGEGVVVDLATTATSPLPFPAPAAPYERPLPAGSIRLDQP